MSRKISEAGFVNVTRERFDDFVATHELDVWQDGPKLVWRDENLNPMAVKFPGPGETFYIKSVNALL